MYIDINGIKALIIRTSKVPEFLMEFKLPYPLRNTVVKMEKDSTRYLGKNVMLEDVTQNKYCGHSLILYSEIANFKYLYLNYIKRSMELLNEIVLVLPHYHPVADIVNNLRNIYVDIYKYKKEGSIVVVQSKKAYYSLSQEFVGVVIMTKMLLKRADKLGKSGVTVISDIIQEYASYSFICSGIVHVAKDDVIKNKNKVVDKLVTSGYAMVYYSAVSLHYHLLSMQIIKSISMYL
jgi:hypothetical protein